MSDDARKFLADLVRHLLQGDKPYVVPFAVVAIRGFLNGKHRSLDAAFEIGSRKRGRPKARKIDKHYKMACKVFDMRLKEMSFEEIGTKLGWEDDQELRKIHDRFFWVIVQEEYADKIKQSMIERD